MPAVRKLGIVMDPIESIKPWKDSTLAMMLEAQARGWQLYYFMLEDILLDNAIAMGDFRTLAVHDDNEHWFDFLDAGRCRLDELDVILMRKDPPFDLEYIYCTHILEQAEENGVLVVNRPASLRDCNEKLFTRVFPQCCVETLVSRKSANLKAFIAQHRDVIVKPLDGMGGQSIFRVQAGDLNTNAIIEAVSKHGRSQTMAQRYIPEIRDGDKRILLIDGVAVPYALARLPAAGENRGNIAAGASTRGQPLSERDQWLCDQVGDELRARGLLFVGIDVIGDYITEINVTSPTCIRELDRDFGLNISADLFECIERRISA
ncbi:MAG: glutathione synthase [Gammaproteobacteria bacterium]|nr:glutathione synthase [Gammaproteobacteria bacterium]MDH3447663.1 glutathione synthase [Gammaproteobacteria bacterium]